MFRIIDLTQTLSNESLSYPGTTLAWTAERIDIGNPTATLTRFSAFDPHAGTHLDAPLHFALTGMDVAELPLRLYPATVVAVDRVRIEAARIPADCMGRAVLFSTGWDDRVGKREYYEGFPSMTRGAAQLLVDRGVGLVGVDGPSLDGADEHPTYSVHEAFGSADVPIVEGLVNLRSLLSIEGEILFAAFPLKLRGVEGSPVRAVALVRE